MNNYITGSKIFGIMLVLNGVVRELITNDPYTVFYAAIGFAFVVYGYAKEERQNQIRTKGSLPPVSGCSGIKEVHEAIQCNYDSDQILTIPNHAKVEKHRITWVNDLAHGFGEPVKILLHDPLTDEEVEQIREALKNFICVTIKLN